MDESDSDVSFHDAAPDSSDVGSNDDEAADDDNDGVDNDGDLPKEFVISPDDWLTVKTGKKRKLVHDSEVFDYNKDYAGVKYYTCHFYPKSRGGEKFQVHFFYHN